MDKKDLIKSILRISLLTTASWYLIVFFFFSKNSHQVYDLPQRAEKKLISFYDQKKTMNDSEFEKAFKSQTKIESGNIAYNFDYDKVEDKPIIYARPVPEIIESTLAQKILFLDFTRIKLPGYKINLNSSEIKRL